MDEHNDNQLIESTKVRGELQSVSKYWERCKDEKRKVFDREHKHLSDRLVKLAQEQEMSKLEFEELSSLLNEMDSLEKEVENVGQLSNIIKRHDCIEMCRNKIEDILRRSRLRRKSEPVELGNAQADLECTSAHRLAVAKQQEKKRILQQYRPAQSQERQGYIPKVPTATKLRESTESLASSSRPDTSGTKSPADAHRPMFDETFRKRMITTSSGLRPVHDKDQDQFKRQALMAASTPHYSSLAPSSRAGSGNALYHGRSPLTQSEERALLFSIGRGFSSHYRPSASSLKRGSDLHSLSGAAVSHHSDDRFGTRRRLAMESLLNQINEYRAAQHSIHPKDLLSCRYLRLTPSNIAQLERQCRELGRDPGLHGHLTEQQVLDHFDHLEAMSAAHNYSNNLM